ncbi:aminotransferase class I/II-fold pyridoxal phosphate-dependent enzyme, partial [Staphylococcus epidermidis]|uniref:aminotransferase class I/II-fold pyridoxal phosphate-dependent enzyme n=1 Tax=Staphylococcus epidermidis TaxID=1282 RepID=UPI0030C4E029
GLDEAYGEFVTAEDFPNALELQEKYKNLFVLRTFSKAYGLASMRIGYVIGDQKIIEKFNIIKPPFNIGRLSEIAAITA